MAALSYGNYRRIGIKLDNTEEHVAAKEPGISLRGGKDQP